MTPRVRRRHRLESRSNRELELNSLGKKCFQQEYSKLAACPHIFQDQAREKSRVFFLPDLVGRAR